MATLIDSMPASILIPVIAHWIESNSPCIDIIMATARQADAARECRKLVPATITYEFGSCRLFLTGKIDTFKVPSYVVAYLSARAGQQTTVSLVTCFRESLLLTPPIPRQLIAVNSTGSAWLVYDAYDRYKQLCALSSVSPIYKLCRETSVKPYMYIVEKSDEERLFRQSLQHYAIAVRPGVHTMAPGTADAPAPFVLVFIQKESSRFGVALSGRTDIAMTFASAENIYRSLATEVLILSRIDVFLVCLYIATCTKKLATARSLFNLPSSAYAIH